MKNSARTVREKLRLLVDGKFHLVEGTDFIVSYENNVNAGKGKVIIKGTGKVWYGEATETFTINKAANPLAVSGKTATVKYKKLKKKAQTLAASKVMTVSKNQGKLKYKLVSVSKPKYKKYFKIDTNSGKVTIKKKLKKGTYTLKVNVTAVGNGNFKSKTKPVTIKIKVK